MVHASATFPRVVLPSIPPDIDISPAERIRIDTRLSLIERERSVLERIASRVLSLLDSLEAEQTRLEDRLAKPSVLEPEAEPDRQAMTASGTLTDEPNAAPEPAANDTPGVPTIIPVQATRPLYHALVASRLTGGRSGPVVPPPPSVKTGPTLIPAPPQVHVRRRDTAPLVLR